MSTHPTVLIVTRDAAMRRRIDKLLGAENVIVCKGGDDSAVIGRRFAGAIVLEPGHDIWVSKQVLPRLDEDGEFICV